MEERNAKEEESEEGLGRGGERERRGWGGSWPWKGGSPQAQQGRGGWWHSTQRTFRGENNSRAGLWRTVLAMCRWVFSVKESETEARACGGQLAKSRFFGLTRCRDPGLWQGAWAWSDGRRRLRRSNHTTPCATEDDVLRRRQNVPMARRIAVRAGVVQRGMKTEVKEVVKCWPLWNILSQ